MKRFFSRLHSILENLEASPAGRIDILHRNGRHIVADFVKKVRSPKGGRAVLVAGIGAASKADGYVGVEDILRKFWTYRLKDFYEMTRMSNQAQMSDISFYSGRATVEKGTRHVKIQPKFKHILKIDLRNVISINGQPVQQQAEGRPSYRPDQKPTATQPQTDVSAVAPDQFGAPGN
jgi:hypothetical protein